MTFTIFHKTGEQHDAQGEYDGDIGYEEEIEVHDDEVCSLVAGFMYNYFFKKNIKNYEKKEIELSFEIIKCIKNLISELEILDEVVAMCHDDLCDHIQAEYGDDWE